MTNSGKPWVTFRIAANERRKNEAGDWIDGDSLYLDVTSWRAAEQIKEQLTKGNRVIVYGTLRSREYETKDNQKRTTIELLADVVAIQLNDKAEPRTITAATPAADPWGAAATTAATWPATDDKNAPF